MKKYLSYFAEKKKKYPNDMGVLMSFLSSLSKKQIFVLCLLLVAFSTNLIIASTSSGNDALLSGSFKSISSILSGNEDIKAMEKGSAIAAPLIVFFTTSYFIIDIIKNVMSYISKVQIQSVETLGKIDFGSENMFDHIVSAITLFAVIGCVYRLVSHYLKTERLDTVSAYTGYFSYIGLFLLFIFSGKIVDRIVSLNKPISKTAMNQIYVKIDNELNRVIVEDFTAALKKIKQLDKEYEDLGTTDVSDKLSNRIDKHMTKFWDMGLKHMFKYFYYAFFSLIMTVVLAVPAFSITFMVKVLLGVMIAGTKLVFLISFIPGFENTWRTYILNLLNVILWIPIFLSIISFLTNIIAFTISDNSMGTGQIIWLSLVVVIGAFQSVSLTTTAAGTIINGAGASMAGAMGSLASMNGASMVAGAGQAALSGATNIVGGFASSAITSKMTANAIQKYMK